MDPRRRHHHHQPPSPSFHSATATSRRYNNAPPSPPLPPRFLDPPSHTHHRSSPYPHPILHHPFSRPPPPPAPPPPPIPNHHHHDHHLYMSPTPPSSSSYHQHPPDLARRKFLLEAAEMEDRRHVERLLFDCSRNPRVEAAEEAERVFFVDPSQIIPNPRVSDRIVFPDGHPEAAPRRGGMLLREDPRDRVVVGDHVDDRNFRFRVSSTSSPSGDVRRGVPGRWGEEMESRPRHVVVESGGNVVGRKRHRREQEEVILADGDGFLVEEGYDGRGQRKAGFCGNGRGGLRHRDMPFEREPSEASSHSHGLLQHAHLTDRARGDVAGFVFGRHQRMESHPVDDSEDLEKSRLSLSGAFNVESSHGLPGENRYVGKGKRVLFGGENIQDVVVGKKPSVLSRIQYAQPVWNRLEEQKHMPPSSSALSDTGTQNNPVELDVGFKSNALVAKEVLPSPPFGDLQSIDGTNGKGRNLKKETPKESAVPPDVSGKASATATATSTTANSNKSTTKKIPVSLRTQLTKKSDGRVIQLNRSKKTMVVGTSDSRNGKLKSIKNALASGISIDTSKVNEQNNTVEVSKKTKVKEASVPHSIRTSKPDKKATPVAFPKVEVPKDTCNAHSLTSSDCQKSSLVTSKLKVVKKPTVLPHRRVVKSSGGNSTVKGIFTEKVTRKSVVPFSPSTDGNSTLVHATKDLVVEEVLLSPGIITAKSDGKIKDIIDDAVALDYNGKINEAELSKEKTNNNSLVSHTVLTPKSDGKICGLETPKKEESEETLDAPAVTSVPKYTKEASPQMTLVPPSTCTLDSQAEVTPMHHLKKEVSKDTLISPGVCQLNFAEIVGKVKVHTREVQEEMQGRCTTQCNGETAKDRTSNEQASQERFFRPSSTTSGKGTSEVAAKLEELFVSPKPTLVSPEYKVTTAESSLKRVTDETLLPRTSVPVFGLTCSDKMVEENLFSPSPSTNNNKNVGSTTRALRKRKRALPSPGSTQVSCKKLGPNILSKDPTSTFSEEAQVLLGKKKRRKKKWKVCSPAVSALPSSNPTKENCDSLSFISSDKISLSSERSSVSCKNPNQLEEVCDVLMHLVPSSGLKSPTVLSSPHKGLNNPELSGKASLRVVSNKDASSLEKTTAKASAQENLVCPTLEDDRNCRSPKYSRKEGFLFHQDNVRDSNFHTGGSLPVLGDSKQLADGVELVNPICEAGTMTNVVEFDCSKSVEDAENSVVNKLVEKSITVNDISGGEREIEQEVLIPSNACTKLEVPTVFAMGNIKTDIAVHSIHTEEEGRKIQQVPALLSSELQASILDSLPVVMEGEGDCQNLQLEDSLVQSNSLKLEKDGLLVLAASDGTYKTTTHSLAARIPKLDSQELDKNVPEKVCPIQTDQPSDFCCDNKLTNREDSEQSSLISPIKRSASEPQLGMEMDETLNFDDLVHENKMPLLLQEAKKHFTGSSKVVAKEASSFVKDCHNSLLPQILPHQASFAARPLARVTPTQNGRHRIWRRTDSSCASQPTGQQLQLKLANSSSSQRQLPKKLGKPQGSYVRKGNSLIRKSSTTAPLRQSYDLGASCQADRHDTSNSTTSESKIDNSDVPTCSKFGGISPNIERPKTPPLALSSKLTSCTTNPLSFVCPRSDNPSREVGSEVQAVSSKNRNFGLGSPEHQSFPSTEKSKTCTLKPMIYVKHKSNQLVAATGVEIGNSSSLVNERAHAVSSSSLSDVYFMRKKNQLVRDSSLSNRHLKQVGLTENSKSESQKASRTSLPEEKFRIPKRKPVKGVRKKLSLVWRLDGMESQDKELCSMNNILPRIFPWKRAIYWRPSMSNTSKKHSIALISKKLQLSRKRNTLYTVSKGGFSLRKSGVLSIGGSNLTWSKSIEKRSKKANEVATLAVAEVERKKRELKEPRSRSIGGKSGNRLSRERVFRVGTVRYKMDSSRRTLVRIPDLPSSSPINQQSGYSTPNSFIPRRLLIGHDEYIRIGNGNKLVRDPKKLVRILASEKIRWSLHTARKRLARKQQYCQFFTRFGKCNKENGKCPYIHDPSKVAICTKFLKGICSGANCRLTHKVIPERMPDCSYFLQGLCTNTGCPYRHVNVHPKSSVCEGFLKGYCSDGDECRKKHSYVCPDFEATGKCLEGSACKLHHPKQRNKSRKRKRNAKQISRKSRYFVSSITEVCQRRDPRVNPKEKSEDIFFSEGHFAEYIELDPDSEDYKDDPVNSHPSIELDTQVSEKSLDDLSALIKPVRVMAS